MKKNFFVLGMLLWSMALADQPIAVNFALKAGDLAAECAEPLMLGSTQTATQLLDARLFVSDLEVLTSEGSFAVDLEQDGVWQYQNTALLDFEDASGMCQGNTELNTQIKGSTSATGTITGVRFTIGVPEALNHLDAATAASPLNITDMWWVWRTGYKFLRIDLQGHSGMATRNQSNTNQDHSAANAYFIHLGSTECMSADPTLAPTDPCGNANRIQISLDNFNPEQHTVVVDLSLLLAQVDVSQSLALEPPGCMSGITDPDCEALFATGFGLSLEDGRQLLDSPGFVRFE